MTHDQLQHDTDEQGTEAARFSSLEAFLPQLRAYLMEMQEVRLAYFQPAPDEDVLSLGGPDHPRVVINFSRSASSEHVGKRLQKIRQHFAASLPEQVEFLDIERLDYREAAEVAFNAWQSYGSMEMGERDRLYRYNVFLEWNAGKKFAGVKQDQAPALVPAFDHPVRVVSIERFVTPIYRHLKLIENYLRELRRVTSDGLPAFLAESTLKSLTESYMLKVIQSTILITLSMMHRTMRLTARDYRDLFLLLPVYGMTTRERAAKLVQCAEIRDRLMFKYDEVSPEEVFQQAQEVAETLRDFKAYMLEWVFEHYYGTSGELLSNE